MNEAKENETMRVRSLGDLLCNYRLIVPEIQREYVWGDPSIGRNVLGHFFKDFMDDFNSYCAWRGRRDEVVCKLSEKYRDLESPEDMLLHKATKCLEESGDFEPSTNVGFVYVYFSGNRTNEDDGRTTANLIDGQQRFTTYFLMLLHVAYRAGRFQDFQRLVRPPDGKAGVDPAFDFNVRVLTHEFLSVLINKVGDVVEGEGEFSFSDMPDATWYLQEYRGDVSVRSMTNALKAWGAEWGARSKEEASLCYDYLLNNVKFMFFRIEAVQGEQLYISMNGRGRNLSQPEIMRAKVFRDAASSVDACEVGKTFEAINDFFWRHRIENELTADAGEKKFFRWVYLIWKYEVLSSTDGEDRSKALQEFQCALQTRTRSGKVEFNLDEDMFGKDAITFDLIKKTYHALEHLFDTCGNRSVCLATGSEVKKTLVEYLPSVSKSTDGNEAFQQDCFCLLPMLRFLMKEQEWMSDVSLERQLSLARYLRNLVRRSAIQKGVNDLVDRAMDLAESFAESKVSWLEFLGTRDPGRMTPEDEILKANRLHGAASDSQVHLVELISEVEDYKLALPESGDANICAFLDLRPTWKTEVWNRDVYSEFQGFFHLIQSWFARLDTDRLHTTEWMMCPAHRGYRLRGSDKISRFSKTEIFESRDLLGHICLLEEKIAQSGALAERVFDEEAKGFLKEFWPRRNVEKDAITLAALALVSSRIVRSKNLAMPSYDNAWANVQYWKTFYDHNASGDKYEEKDVTPVGGADFSLYFWHMDYADTNWRWSWPKACRDRLFACHKVTSQGLDVMVKDFCASLSAVET